MDIYTIASLIAFGAMCLTWLAVPEPAAAATAEAQQAAPAAA